MVVIFDVACGFYETVVVFQVSPQFRTSVAAAAPRRRGRGRCRSATSILDSRSQLDRRTSASKFPSLTFMSGLRNQPHQQQSGRTRKTAAQKSDKPKGHTTSVRKGNEARSSDDAASTSRCLTQPGTPSAPVRPRGTTPATLASPHFNSFGPPSNVDTPDVTQEGRESPSPGPLHMLLHRSCSPCSQPPDILVADTPEGDYGLKVTWRRRKDLMTVMKERGHLSESDMLIHSSYRELAR